MPRAIHHQSLKTSSTPLLDHAMPPKNGAASPDVSPTAGADSPSISVLIMRVATASGKKVESHQASISLVQTDISFPGGARDSQDDRGGPVWGMRARSRAQG